jgi:AcrR family transcriptional regulator
MRKGEATRSEILRRSAALFNTQGYFGSSLADIMAATGLKKGGIYNHFASKDELALNAFDCLFEAMKSRLLDAVASASSPPEQLLALIDTFCGLRSDPDFQGGCPLLNTAVESDDAHPALRERVHNGFAQWHGLLKRIIGQGIQQGDFRDTLDAGHAATTIIITLEGAMALSGVFGEADPLGVAREHLHRYIDTEMRQ